MDRSHIWLCVHSLMALWSSSRRRNKSRRKYKPSIDRIPVGDQNWFWQRSICGKSQRRYSWATGRKLLMEGRYLLCISYSFQPCNVSTPRIILELLEPNRPPNSSLLARLPELLWAPASYTAGSHWEAFLEEWSNPLRPYQWICVG